MTGLSTGGIVGLVLLLLAILIGWTILIWYIAGYTARKLRTSQVLMFFLWLLFPPLGLLVTIVALFMPEPMIMHHHVHGDKMEVGGDVHDDIRSLELKEFISEEKKIKEKEETKEKEKEKKEAPKKKEETKKKESPKKTGSPKKSKKSSPPKKTKKTGSPKKVKVTTTKKVDNQPIIEKVEINM